MIRLRFKPLFCCNPLLAAAVAGGSSLLGSALNGILGSNAQSKANKSNLQIARETNQMQMDMFKRQLNFNTFVNQRKMLEEAGYSPYSLFGTSSQSAPSAPNLNAPTMLPVDAAANAVGSATGNLAEILRTFAEAKKVSAEAKSADIYNRTLPYMLDAQLRGVYTDNDIKSINKIIMQATQQDVVDMAGIQKLLMEANYNLTQEQVTRAIIENAYEREFGGRKRQKEIDALAAKAYKDFEDGILTSKEIKYLPTRIQVLLREIKAQESHVANEARANEIGAYKAKTERMSVQQQGLLIPSQIEFNLGAAMNQRSNRDLNVALRRFKDREFEIFDQLGYYKMHAEIQKIIKEGNLSAEQQKFLVNSYEKLYHESEEAYWKAQKTRSEVDWKTYEEINEGVRTASDFLKGLGAFSNIFK